MTKITTEEVRHVAQLSRLKLDNDQVEKMAQELDTIVSSIKKISELDLDGVEPTTHPVTVVNVFGADEPHESLSPEQALASAPDPEDGCFRVPRMHA